MIAHPADTTIKKPMPVKASSQAGIYAEHALQRMRALGVLPTPQNYSLFFAYVSGYPAGVVKALEEAIAKKMHLSEAFLASLYTAHLADPQTQAVQYTSVNAKRILLEIMQAVTQFEGATSAFGREIAQQLDTMDERISEEMVRILAQSLIDEAQVMQGTSEAVSQRMTMAQREISDLRDNLARAMIEAERDFLTGTYNRKAFDKRLKEMMLQARAENTELVLMMLDIDHFASFNEGFGHVMGDEVIKVVARTLVDTLKGADHVARYGGEEFAVILPKTPSSGAMTVAEILRKSIAGKELKRKSTGENFGVITVSMGVTAFRPEEDTPSQLVTRAQAALTQAKQGGRNRIIHV